MTDEVHDILIVDDQPANLAVLSRLLGETGFKVRAVTSGDRALEAIRVAAPDCILLDVNMPVMNGYEVCTHLQSDEKLRGIPVIFLTAFDDAEYKVKAFAVGGRDYISKPFQAEEVLARVRNQLQIKELETRLRVQNETLMHANARLQEAGALKGRVTAMLVHDLRNPLCLLRAALFEDVDSQTRDDAQLAYDRIDQMLREMLELSKSESVLQRSIEGSTEANDVIARVVRLSARLAGARGVQLSATPWGEPLFVRGNTMDIERVFTNLLDNALKFTPVGGTIVVRVQVEMGTGVESGLSFASVSVTDSGPGIAPEELPFIFDPYRQTATAQGLGGFGLGLAIVARIVASQGGRIRVHSQVGVGSEFRVLLRLPDSEDGKSP